ncbi:MAG: hypothetical protein ACR2QK_20065 [Acidimicrobiales bacterium]
MQPSAQQVFQSLSQGRAIVEEVEKWQEQTSRLQPSGLQDSRSQASSADSAVDELTSIRFAQIARQVNQAAKDQSLRPPAFRSPPRAPGLRRSIKRRPDGSATFSVSLRGRPAVAVVADMIDGVMAANEPCSTRSAEIRDRLWSAATPFLSFQVEAAAGRTYTDPGRRAA